MKHVFKLLTGLGLLAMMAFTEPTPPKNCKLMHEGKFTYGQGKEMAIVEIKGEDHIEYHDNLKYYIRSKIKWVSECEYNMTMTEITIPGFPYAAGDVMNVQINKVDGMDIYYTSTVKGEKWTGKFTKVK